MHFEKDCMKRAIDGVQLAVVVRKNGKAMPRNVRWFGGLQIGNCVEDATRP